MTDDHLPLFFRGQCPATTIIDGKVRRCALREGHERYLDGGVVADPQHVAHIRWDAKEADRGRYMASLARLRRDERRRVRRMAAREQART